MVMDKRLIILTCAILGVPLVVIGWLLMETGVLETILGAFMLTLGIPLLMTGVGIWIVGRNNKSQNSSGLDLH